MPERPAFKSMQRQQPRRPSNLGNRTRLGARHVHDLPLHERARAQVLQHHLLDDRLGEVDVGDARAAVIIPAHPHAGLVSCRWPKLLHLPRALPSGLCTLACRAHMSAERSELPQPMTRMLAAALTAGNMSGRSCRHSPYHSKGFCLRASKKRSQKATDLKSSKLLGSWLSKLSLPMAHELCVWIMVH